MAERAVVITKCDLTIQIQDSGGNNVYTVAVEPGDLAYTAARFGLTRVHDNGKLHSIRRNDEVPLTLTFSVHLRDVGKTTVDFTLPDIAEVRGHWAATATSTTANQSDVETYDVVVTIDGVSFGLADQTMTFPNMWLSGSGTLGGFPASYSVAGESATDTIPTVV